MQVGDSFEIADRTFKLIEILEQPNTGLAIIAESRGVDTFKFTIPIVILEELAAMTKCPICEEEHPGGLESCADCYNRALGRKKENATLDGLAKRNAELQYQLEQMTARRNDALQIIEAKREVIQELKKNAK